MKYTIYQNRVHKYAAIHKETCPFLKMHGGVSTTTPPTGEYSEGIESLDAAAHKAASTGWEVRFCGHCNPVSPIQEVAMVDKTSKPGHDLINLLDQFNLKERYFVVSNALGFSLDARFCKELGGEIGIEIPPDARAWMDYHLDYVVASIGASCHGSIQQSIDVVVPNTDDLISGKIEDIDFLIAFKKDQCYHLVFIEAKAYTRGGGWKNEQMLSKAERLKKMFGQDGKKHSNVNPHFCLISPHKPQGLKTELWPDWMKKKDSDPYYWVELNVEPSRLKVERCDFEGNLSKAATHYRISRV